MAHAQVTVKCDYLVFTTSLYCLQNVYAWYYAVTFVLNICIKIEPDFGQGTIIKILYCSNGI